MGERADAAPLSDLGALFHRWGWEPTRPLGRLVARINVFAILAMAVATTIVMLGWHGADLPAQLYHQTIFRSFGFIIWDGYWYAGHYWLSYSILGPVLMAVLGLGLCAIIAATLSAWAFDRLITAHLKRNAWLASTLFAIGTAVPVVIGQLTFLMGQTAGLIALLAVQRRRNVVTIVSALICSMISPVAGVFLVIALVALLITDSKDRVIRGVAVGAVIAPVAITSLVFRQYGTFPFPVAELAIVLACCVGVFFILPAQQRTIRVACALYGVGAIATFVIPNPLGGNLIRLAAYVAAPLIVAFARIDRRRLAAASVGLLVVWQASPAIGALAGAAGDPSRDPAYFAPLIQRLEAEPTPSRVEIPFTSQHWETAYVAPRIPLARGWERQVDKADNPLFYEKAPLNASTYGAWLRHNGITWVALPDVELDYSSIREAALIRAGLPYLDLVWSNAHWRLYRVRNSPGLITGSARLAMPKPDQLVLTQTRPGYVTVRVKFTPDWHVTKGRACVSEDASGWTRIHLLDRSTVQLEARPGVTGYDCTKDGDAK